MSMLPNVNAPDVHNFSHSALNIPVKILFYKAISNSNWHTYSIITLTTTIILLLPSKDNPPPNITIQKITTVLLYFFFFNPASLLLGSRMFSIFHEIHLLHLHAAKQEPTPPQSPPHPHPILTNILLLLQPKTSLASK